ncbi:hypothetical protein [Polaribacter atrinae]|nr:hypothetical protein [Polaribacter atrinae]
MKKGVLILIGMFFLVSTIKAENNKEVPNKIGFNYSYENTVNFVERDVEFFIFTNGEFDFNTHYTSNRNEIGVFISRDYRGRIERIGNSFINYDRYGNVTRIGNVFMKYYRGQLTDVGNLKIRYDHWGNPKFYGNVKDNYYHYNGLRINLNIGNIFEYNNSYFSHRDFARHYSKIREDNKYYYYKANPNAKIGNKSKILRRRKPAPVTRRSNTTYRKPVTINSNRRTVVGKRNNSTTRRSTTINTNKNGTIDRRNNSTVTRRPTTVTRGKTTSVKRNDNNSNRKPTVVKRKNEKKKATTKEENNRKRRS